MMRTVVLVVLAAIAVVATVLAVRSREEIARYRAIRSM
jgi:hypothetical protein